MRFMGKNNPGLKLESESNIPFRWLEGVQQKSNKKGVGRIMRNDRQVAFLATRLLRRLSVQ